MCQRCGGRADVYLCRECGKQLRDNLKQIPWLSDRVAEAAVKETNITLSLSKIGRAPKTEDEEESPVPFSQPAHQAYAHIETVLRRWVRDFCDQLSVEFEPIDTVPADFIGPLPRFGRYRQGRYVADPRDRRRIKPGYLPTIRDMARWLGAHYLDIVNSEDAAYFSHEIDTIIHSGLDVINPPRKTFAGRCPTKINGTDEKCGVDIWIDWNDDTARIADFVTCHRCKTTHDSKALRDNALREAEHMLMTQSEIIDIMAKFGEPLSPNTFKKWRKNKRLTPRGWKYGDRIIDRRIHHYDPAVYRFGDVRTLCENRRHNQRKTADATA